MDRYLRVWLSRQEETLSRQRRFVADASHELRTPLTTIEGYAEMLEEWALRYPQTAHESVHAIREESKRVRDMVEGLLGLAQGDEGADLQRYAMVLDLGLIVCLVPSWRVLRHPSRPYRA